jgi:hypothetical protein
MRRIVRFARAPASDRRLLSATAATRVGPWLFPFGVVQRVAARLERRL